MSREDDRLFSHQTHVTAGSERPGRSPSERPLRIAVAPTIRLSEEAPRRPIGTVWPHSDPRLLLERIGRPKPRLRQAQLLRFLRRDAPVAHPPSLLLDRGHSIVHPPAHRRVSFSQRVRDRALVLCVFASISLMLSVVSPLGVFPSALSLAAAWAELNVGWARLSQAATRYVRMAIAMSALGVSVQAFVWVFRLSFPA